MEPRKGPPLSSQNSSEPRGLLCILVSASAFLFGWSLSKRFTPSQDSRETVHPQDTPEREGHSSQALSTGPLVIDSPINPHKSNNESKHKTPFWEKAAVLVALGLLLVNICQMRATQKAADAATKAADTATRQLEATDRPWIKIEVTFAEPVTYKDGLNVAVNFIPTNIGHSPAQSIQIKAALVPATLGDDIVGIQKDICNGPGNPFGPGYMLFPGDHYAQPWGMTLSAKEFDKYWARMGGTGGVKVQIAPTALVGCIDYTFDASKRRHQTGFAFDLVTKDGRIIPISNIPLDVFLRSRISGSYAN